MSRARHPWLLVASLLVFAARPGAAQTAAPAGASDETPHITVGTEIFPDYVFTSAPQTTDAAGNVISPNAFGISRAYIDVTGRLSRAVTFRITPDIVRETDTFSSLYGSLVYRVKFAYGQVSINGEANGSDVAWMRFGVQPTPFVGYEEQIYRYRFQGPVFVDRVGALVDADAGVSFHAALPGGYGEVEAGVFNGEGFASAEANNQKAFDARGTLRPFARASGMLHGLRVTGFFDSDHYLDSVPRRRVVFNATFEHRRFNAGFDYLNQVDQPLPDAAVATHRGWSTWVTPFFKVKGSGPEMLLRYDAYTLERANAATRRRTIAGFAYWFPHPAGDAAMAILGDFEQVTFEGFAPVPANDTQRAIAIHALIDF